MAKQLPVRDIIEWDILNWSQLFRYWEPVIKTIPKQAKILAIGERNGGLSLWLALCGYKVVCTDRMGPFTEARALHEKYNVAEKIIYQELDIVNCNSQQEEYDLIIAKSVLGGLKADPSDRSTRTFAVQQKAVDNIYSLLKPGGYFLSAENLQGSGLMRFFRQIKKKDIGWRYLSLQEMYTLHSFFSIFRINTFGVLPTSFKSKALNYIIFVFNALIGRLMPARSKYIAFSFAKK